MDGYPVGFDMTTMSLLRPRVGEQLRLKHRIGYLLRQRPTQTGGAEALKRRPHRRCPGDLVGRYVTNELQPKNFAHVAHSHPLCWHPVSPSKVKGADLSRPAEAPAPRAKSSRNGGRHHSGIMGGFVRNAGGFK